MQIHGIEDTAREIFREVSEEIVGNVQCSAMQCNADFGFLIEGKTWSCLICAILAACFYSFCCLMQILVAL